MSASHPAAAHGAPSASTQVDSMEDLKRHLKEAMADPTDVIEQGIAPPPYFFVLEPVTKDEEGAEKFEALLSAAAVARIFAAMDFVQGSGKGKAGGPYSLRNPDEYVPAFNEKTKITVNTFLTRSMSGMYTQLPGGTVSKLNLDITRRDLHAKIVQLIFGGLDRIGEKHRKDLDKLLTSFTTALKPFKVPGADKPEKEGDEDDQPELQHAVIVNYVKATDITGGSGGDGGLFIYKPSSRIVVFSVKPRQWSMALDKSSHTKPDPKPDPKPKPGLGEEPEPSDPDSTPSGHGHDAGATHGTADAASASHGSEKVTTKGWWWPKPKPDPEHEKIKFTLTTTIVELELNEDKFKAGKSKFEAVFRSVAKDDQELSVIADNGGLKALGESACTVYRELEA
ncbi:uncharacterized protein C8A04DRAFT_30928 [Dichotomopilus funicola]|uniref:Uncharacterized protein n=1 Tax=Dichotomopilus funicola TaxID=1934379 RepID=A0AAN6UYJ8_9PEZI|nr:hypothetical protein C8A04DRAFT_30928 [Dichotomopilus funicola]